MNLRELIFSQSQTDGPNQSQSQILGTPEVALYNSSIRPMGSDDESNKTNPPGPLEISSFQSKKRKHVNEDAEKMKVLPVYHHAPRVQQRMNVDRQRGDGARMPVFAPGLLSDMSGQSKRRNQKEELRKLWHRCYFGKDFEGAAMSLGVLAEIDPIKPHDVTSAAHLLRYSQSHVTSTKKLVQGVLKPFSRGGERKSSAITVSVEMLASIGEIAAARKLLQDNIVDLTYQGKTQLLCYDTIATILGAVTLADDVCRASGKSILCPSFNDILRDPFEFSKCIRIINTVRCSVTLVNAKVKAKKQACKLLLQDLKGSFNLSVAGTSVVHDRMGMEELYLAYLVGLEHTSKASRYLANLKHQLPVTGDTRKDQGLQAQYYHLLARYLIRYRYSLPEAPTVVGVRPAVLLSTDCGEREIGETPSSYPDADLIHERDKVASATSSSVGGGTSGDPLAVAADYTTAIVDAGYLRVVNALVRSVALSFESHAPFTPSLWTLHLLRLLYQAKAIDTKKMVTYICDMIEYSGQSQVESNKCFISPDSNSNVVRDEDTLNYLLWRCLCETLGPIEPQHQISGEAKILTNSDVMKYLSRYACEHIPVDDAAVMNKRLSSRQWWKSSILSSSQLDNYQTSADCFGGLSQDQCEDFLGELEDEMHAERNGPNDEQFLGDSAGSSCESGEDDGPVLMAKDLYWAWRCSDRTFTSELRDISITAQRKMSVGGLSDAGSDADVEGSLGEEEDDEANGDGDDGKDEEDRGQGETPDGKNKSKKKSKHTSGKEGGATAADAEDGGQLSQASHDEVEYQSQESEAEWIAVGIATGSNPVSSLSSSSSSSTSGSGSAAASGVTVQFLHEILSLSVCGGLYSGDRSVVVDDYEEDCVPNVFGNIGMTEGTERRNRDNRELCVKPSLLSQEFSVLRVKNSNTKQEKLNKVPHAPFIHVIGDRLLEILTYQAIVRAHIDTQDNLFTIRVVQVIVSHALCVNKRILLAKNGNSENKAKMNKAQHTAKKLGVCVVRALKIADCLSSKSVDNSLPPAWQHNRQASRAAVNSTTTTTAAVGMHNKKKGCYIPV